MQHGVCKLSNIAVYIMLCMLVKCVYTFLLDSAYKYEERKYERNYSSRNLKYLQMAPLAGVFACFIIPP